MYLYDYDNMSIWDVTVQNDEIGTHSEGGAICSSTLNLVL